MKVHFVYYTDMGQPNKQPFSIFGNVLQDARTQLKKTRAEVSGAVEISEDQLEKFENGEKRPTEDILHLLIQHFQLREDQAAEWWRLAGYEKAQERAFYSNDDLAMHNKDIQSLMYEAEDDPIVYTDMVQIMVNNYGVIMNFMQGAGSKSRPLAVARVGMSKEHARSVLQLLQTTLSQADSVQSQTELSQQKLLPGSKQDSQKQ
jgi:transcriptional regulator with XRE-family HTH domain